MASAWLTNVFNFLAGAQYVTSPSAITAGSSGPILCDQFGRLITVPAPPIAGTYGTTWSDVGNVNSTVVKASAGVLTRVIGSNESGAIRWLMVFDATSLPVPGTKPLVAKQVAIAANFDLDFQTRPRAFVNGIVVAFSSTHNTLTVDTTAGGGMWVNVEYA